jgi:tetratricopeptide (TPR) repeat protein
VRQIAKELGVRYVLEGSVRKGGNRVRISAQFIDATTGRHLWAERYDRDLEDIFAVQDEITEAITGATAPAVVSAEERRASGKASENLDIWDMAMRGNWHMWSLSREGFSEARRLFQEAIAIDPNGTIAQIGLALAFLLEAGAGWAADIQKNLEIATKAAQKAVAIDDRDAMAHAALAMALHISQDNELAVEACRKALELNPNLSFAEGLLGLACAHLGDYQEANRHLDIAERLSPREQTLPWTNLGRVISSLVAERYEEYLIRTRSFTQAAPNFVSGWRHLAAAYAILGRMDEARTAVEQVLKLSPQDSIEVVQQAVPIVHVEGRAKYIEALREAGLPEQ